uniref:Uncharacterized protein n=1 Tax=viral metagenome TaxID=1070528 RepID=A0A6H1ZE52_9ZZZZ
MGCESSPEIPLRRGPPGREIELPCCPVRFITGDIMRMADAYFLAGKEVSISEQRGMSVPYCDALMHLQSEISSYQANEHKKEAARLRMMGNRR